jgi:para-aminobenzoate synthetase/4-amino-4-deoxychorismate lyase
VLIAAGRPIRLEAHLGRMARSLRDLYGAELPPTLADDAARAALGLELGRMRIDVVPGAGGELRATIKAGPIDPAIFFGDREHGAALRSAQPPHWSGDHKWADRTWLEGVEADFGEEVPLLLDGEEVLEAGRANVFVATGDGLATPPLDGRILPGTARASTMALARELGIEAIERPLTLADLRAAEEVFLTSSLRGIRPARSLDGEPLRQASPLVPRLSEAMRARWLDEA